MAKPETLHCEDCGRGITDDAVWRRFCFPCWFKRLEDAER